MKHKFNEYERLYSEAVNAIGQYVKQKEGHVTFFYTVFTMFYYFFL